MKDRSVFLYFQDYQRANQASLTPVQWQIVCMVYDRTWGWKKMWERIPLRHFTDGVPGGWHPGTGMSKSTVKRTLAQLIGMKVLFRRIQGQSISYCLNADWRAPNEVGEPTRGRTHAGSSS